MNLPIHHFISPHLKAHNLKTLAVMVNPLWVKLVNASIMLFFLTTAYQDTSTQLSWFCMFANG